MTQNNSQVVSNFDTPCASEPQPSPAAINFEDLFRTRVNDLCGTRVTGGYQSEEERHRDTGGFGWVAVKVDRLGLVVQREGADPFEV